MRYAIMHAFATRGQEMEQELEHRLKAALENFDFEKAVNEQARIILYEIVKKSLDDAVNRAFHSPEVASHLQTVVMEAIQRWAR